MLVLFGTWQRSEVVTGMAVWGALVIAGVYMLRAIRAIWHGNKQWPELSGAISVWRKLPYALLLAGLHFRLFPAIVDRQHQGRVAPVVRMVGVEAINVAPVPKTHSPR